MTARKLLTLFTVAVFSIFSLSLAAPAISAGMAGETKGTVTKIEGSKVTIKDAMGVEETVEPKNPEALKGLNVGDQAAVKDGMLTKGGGTEPAPPAPGPKY
ncbi:MAG: hypothetical protein ACM31I_10390 [Deltaproteobacteria bacterium]